MRFNPIRMELETTSPLVQYFEEYKRCYDKMWNIFEESQESDFAGSGGLCKYGVENICRECLSEEVIDGQSGQKVEMKRRVMKIVDMGVRRYIVRQENGKIECISATLPTDVKEPRKVSEIHEYEFYGYTKEWGI